MVKEILREALSSGLGRVGAAILIFIVVMSVYGYLVLPRDFPKLWIDTTGVKGSTWHLNPERAQPSWVWILGFDVAPTRVYSELKPAEERVIIRPGDFEVLVPELRTTTVLGTVRPMLGYTQLYVATYDLQSRAVPQNVVLVLKPVNVAEDAPSITAKVLLLLVRPDNTTVKLLEKDTSTRRELVEKIDCRAYALDYIRFYELDMRVEDICAMRFESPAFMKPSEDGSRLEALPGRYVLKLVIVYLYDIEEVKRMIERGETGFRVEIRVLGNAYGLAGTDIYGRDLYQGLLFGFHIALLVGLFAAVGTVVLGMLLGLLSGYFGGVIDEIVQRTADVIGNIPLLPILMLIGVALQQLGYSGYVILFAIISFLIVFGWGGTAIMVRSMVLSIKSEAYVDAARAVGASSFRIIFRHILPQVLPYTVAVLVFAVPSAIVAEAGLSILGVRHDLPTWGAILAEANRNLVVAYRMWWWILFPGSLLALFSFAFVALGYAIESVVDPRLRR
ncbi:MAG: ABC transporter permease [Acidilobaceae archaeon]